MKSVLNKKICILGLGIENYALLKYWETSNFKLQFSDITICDVRNLKEIEDRLSGLEIDIKLRLGKDYDEDLDEFDVIVRSPGYPLFTKEIQKAKKKGVLITSAMSLFIQNLPTKNVIGVTGSKGKGTTASLIYNILKKAGKKVYLGGNIGVAPFEFLKKIKKTDWVVLELSSFQLEDLRERIKIGVFTNIFKEHLSPADPNNPNYHKSFKKYIEAKLNLFVSQAKVDHAVINEKLKSKLKGYQLDSKIVYYKSSNLKSKLKGDHNKENIAAAVETAKLIKIKKNIIEKAVADFNGLPHRLEKVAVIKGVEYYDDSFATTPEASIIALRSFDKPIILLAGGADKGADFTQFAREIKNKVKKLILFKGIGTDRIKKQLKIEDCKLKIAEVANMKEAVRLAKKDVKDRDVILLSTGCASFGVFKNYKERGDLFKKEVKKQV